MTANERVKVLRKTLKLSGEKFGEALGVKKNAISQIENGINNLSPQMFKAICREFDVNEDWLQNGNGDMFKQLSRSEELTKFFADVLKDEDDSFRKRFIEALAKLDVSDWEVAERFCESILEKRNKKDDQN